MRRDETYLWLVDVRRQLCSPRYVIVVAVLGYFVWGIAGQMLAYRAYTGVAYNAWDVFVGIFGGTANPLPPALVFPLLFVFLSGTTVQHDVASGYSSLVRLRLERKGAYWWVKVASVLATVAITVAVLWALSLTIGVIRGLPAFPATLSAAGGHPNAWGIARGVPPVYYSLPPKTNIVVHGLKVAVYFAFAYFAVVIFVIGLTARAKNTYTPLALGMLVTASGPAMSYAVDARVFNVSLLAALIESSHRRIPALDAPPDGVVPWVSSILMLSFLLASGVIIGWLSTRSPRRSPKSVAARASAAAKVTALLLVVSAAALAAGCVPQDFVSGTMPEVRAVSVPDELSPDELAYLRTVAEQTYRLSSQVDELNAVFGAEHLHDADSDVERLIRERTAAIAGSIRAARGEHVPAALIEWHRVQYAPGLDELEYAVRNLDAAVSARDDVGVRMCLKHVQYADVYFSAAAASVAPLAPSP